MARIDDGHPTIIEFANYPAVKFYERTIKPPGVDGGGAIDITTMRNSVWRTQSPKSLKTLSECSFSAAYDPTVYGDIVDMIQENQLCTITFPDASTLIFWGWVDKFEPGELAEGEQPTADVTIVPSNHDNSDTEVAPNGTAMA